MRYWVCLVVFIVLTGCGGSAAPTVLSTSTPMDEPPLFTPASAKPYTGGEEPIDVSMNAINGPQLGTLKRQDVYFVTESTTEIEHFYRAHYPTYRIDNHAVESDGATLILSIRMAGANGGDLIHIYYRDLGTIGRDDGLLVVTLVALPLIKR